MAWRNSSSEAALKNSMSNGQAHSELITHRQRLELHFLLQPQPSRRPLMGPP